MTSLLSHSLFTKRFRNIIQAEFKTNYKSYAADINLDLEQKTILITDGLSETGHELIDFFARRKARVVFGCNDIEKGMKLKRRLETETNFMLDVYHLDFKSFKSVREFVDDFTKRYEALHILLDNAEETRILMNRTKIGYEPYMAINYLSHALLVLLLKNLLRICQATVVMTCSSWHKAFPQLNIERFYTAEKCNRDEIERYCQAKLATVMFCNEFSKRFKHFHIKIYCCHVGPMETKFHKDTLLYRKILSLFRIINSDLKYMTAKEAVQDMLHTSVMPFIGNYNGHFFQDFDLSERLDIVKDESACQKIFETTKQLIGA